MIDPPIGLDPYASPADPEPQVTGTGLSTGLKTIAIIAVVLGGFGLASVAMGAVGLVLNRQLQSAFGSSSLGGNDNATVRYQQQLQERLAATTDKYLPASLIVLAMKFGVAVVLLVGGVMVLLMKPTGRSILRIGCGLAVFYEFASVTLNSLIQVNNIRIMREMSEHLMGSVPAGGQGGAPAEMVSKVIMVAMFAGLAFAVALTLVKVGYYIISVVYLGKPAVRARFDS